MAKRALDLLTSAIGLMLLSPLVLVLAIWIKLDSRGPVFYRGERVGKTGDLPEVIAPVVSDHVRHAWHLYTIRLNLEHVTINRAQFIEALRKENVGTSVHFIPLHLHPYYRERYGFKEGDFPIAEGVYESVVSLPCYPRMSARDVEDVIAAVRKVVARNRR